MTSHCSFPACTEFRQLEEQSKEAPGTHNRASGRGEETRAGGTRSAASPEQNFLGNDGGEGKQGSEIEHQLSHVSRRGCQ